MPERINVSFVFFEHGRGLNPPAQQTKGAAGADLLAALPSSEPLILQPGPAALTDGLDDLLHAMATAPGEPTAGCDALVARFLPPGRSTDDVAMLWLQLHPVSLCATVAMPWPLPARADASAASSRPRDASRSSKSPLMRRL